MSDTFLHVDSLADLSDRPAVYLAIGVFDGVHLGHQALLTEMIAAARAAGAQPAALTFFPHPARYIRGLTGRYYLTTPADRVALLARAGLDLVITHPFDDTVRQTRAADFIDRLGQYLDLCQLWGGSFSLGYNREGDAEFLRRLGETRGFTVHEYDQRVAWQDEIVSSSRVRRHLSAGEIAAVNSCLGRAFSLTGTVIHGAQRGRTIGFPTANLDVWPEQLLPANGVYATQVELAGVIWPSATNVGVRPTVNGTHLSVEAHLLDFDEDLYGQTVRLHFIDRVRPEQKFAGLDALKAQIQNDVIQVRQMLAQA